MGVSFSLLFMTLPGRFVSSVTRILSIFVHEAEIYNTANSANNFIFMFLFDVIDSRLHNNQICPEDVREENNGAECLYALYESFFEF